MDRGPIHDRLTDIFRDLFGDDDLTLSPELGADDVPGWDSIKHISLIVAIESAFSIKLTTSEIDRLRNVGDLESIIAAKTA